MEPLLLESRASEIAKSIYSYCIARTYSRFEAEDLAQDILLEICRCMPNLRNDDAFYAFMWAVAGNVYKQWSKNRAKRKEYPLPEELPARETEMAEEPCMQSLLRRELSLLAGKYRRAVILYYIENKSCSEIAAILPASESMVKYLLFKSRKLLKEGMYMQRSYGEQSYHPKSLSLLFWGKGRNPYHHLCKGKISQNILFACYNDRLTAGQISLEIGVSLPYMEDTLSELLRFGLLKKEGSRYAANIVIFTKELAGEVAVKTAPLTGRIAGTLMREIAEKESAIRGIGFTGADMSSNAFAWQMACLILYKAVVGRLQNRIQLVYPKDQFGCECFLWATEDGAQNFPPSFSFGIADMSDKKGGYLQFMDFPINGEMVHPYYFDRQDAVNILLDIARGQTGHFSENDRAMAAEMVCRGYVTCDESGLHVNAPVFTQSQYEQLETLLEGAIHTIADEARAVMDTVTEILKSHIPVHLKKQAGGMAYFRLFDDAISAPVARLAENGYLLPCQKGGILPTTYIILK